MLNIRFVGIALLLVQGCGGSADADSGQPDAGENVESPADAQGNAEDGEAGGDAGSDKCLEIAQLWCDVRYRCTPTMISAAFQDKDDCVEQWGDLCEIELNSPGVGYTGAELLACATTKAEASCEDYLQNRQYGTPAFPACDLPAGTGQEGQACLSASGCESGFCEGVGAGCGTCQASAPPAPHGDGCLGVQCAEGEICWKEPGSTEELHCVEAVGIGEPCEGKACDTGLLCTGGVCPPLPFGKEGAPCEQYGDRGMFNSFCYLEEYTCDPGSHTCVPIPTPAGPGESCDDTWGMCAGGGICEGTCRPLAPLGGACEVGECVHSGVCQDGICQLPSLTFCD